MRSKLIHLPDLYLRTIFLVVILLSLYSETTAQTVFEGFSVNPKVGTYSHFNENQGYAVGIEFNRFKENTIYSVDYFYIQEFTLFNSIPDDVFNQIGLMIGKYTGGEFLRIEYQGGLAPVFGRVRTESISGTPGTLSYRYYKEDKFFTVGLAAKLGLKIIPLNFLSLGIDIHTNINLKKSLFFPCISTEIGRLKN